MYTRRSGKFSQSQTLTVTRRIQTNSVAIELPLSTDHVSEQFDKIIYVSTKKACVRLDEVRPHYAIIVDYQLSQSCSIKEINHRSSVV